jgi:predicted nucleic acid-binding protein
MASFASVCRVVTIEAPLILAAAQRAETQRLSLWDALILEASVAAGCRVLVSEDLQHGREYEPGLRVENPYTGLTPTPTRTRRKR